MITPNRALPALLSIGICIGCGSATQSGSTALASPMMFSATRSLSTNDVSVLFPLGRGELWTASLSARGGVLFPRRAFDLINLPIIRELQGPDATYAGLRVVSLRFDPCFGGSPCYRQIRLEGLNVNGASAFDGAIHALYNLTAEEFDTVTARLKAVAVMAPENAAVTRLEVSPALLAQGMTGSYAIALRDLVIQSIGESNLAKVTFMTRSQGGGDRWDFGGFNTRDFQPSGAFSIAGLPGNVLIQTVRENGQRGGGGPPGAAASAYAYTVTPGTLSGELALVLSSGTVQNASAVDRQRAMDALARVENPLAESPDTVDCSACHLANRIRGSLQVSFGLSSALAYTSASEATRLIGGAERNNENLRAFGYFNADPAISQRTANETVRVLAAMR